MSASATRSRDGDTDSSIRYFSLETEIPGNHRLNRSSRRRIHSDCCLACVQLCRTHRRACCWLSTLSLLLTLFLLGYFLIPFPPDFEHVCNRFESYHLSNNSWTRFDVSMKVYFLIRNHNFFDLTISSAEIDMYHYNRLIGVVRHGAKRFPAHVETLTTIDVKFQNFGATDASLIAQDALIDGAVDFTFQGRATIKYMGIVITRGFQFDKKLNVSLHWSHDNCPPANMNLLQLPTSERPFVGPQPGGEASTLTPTSSPSPTSTSAPRSSPTSFKALLSHIWGSPTDVRHPDGKPEQAPPPQHP